MLALLILVAGVVSLFVFGLPLARRAYPEVTGQLPTALLVAPVVGYGLLSSILRLTAELGFGVRDVAWPVLLAGSVVLVLALRRAGLREVVSDLRSSWPVWAVTVAVMGVVSTSYLAVGSRFYRGYSSWDTVYYSAQSEALRVRAPQDVVGGFANQAFVGIATAYDHGPERLGRALVQAFVSTLWGADAGRGTGFLAITAVMLVFLALLFAFRDVPMGRYVRLTAAATGALLPLGVIGGLEGFLPMALLTGCLIATTRLLVDLARHPTWWRLTATSVALAGCFFTLMEAVFVLAALTVVVAVAAPLLERSSLRGPGLVGGAWLLAILLSLPLGGRLWAEITDSSATMTRESLNAIYPFALQPSILTWSYWGTPLIGHTGVLSAAATGVAIVLVLVGLHGTLALLLRDLSVLGAAFSCLAVFPAAFLVSGTDQSYSFVKGLTLGLPVVWMGGWLCANDVSQRVRSRYQDRPKVGLLLGSAPLLFLVVAGLLGSAVSGYRVWLVTADQPVADTTSVRIGTWRSVSSPAQLALFRGLDGTSGEEIVTVYPNTSQEFWWTTYYLRDNRVWQLGPTSDDLYPGLAGPQEDVRDAPPDARLVVGENYDNLGLDDEARDELGIVVHGLLGGTGVPYASVGQVLTVDQLTFWTFAKDATRVRVELESQGVEPVLAQTPGGPVTIDPGANVIELSVPAGGAMNDVLLDSGPAGVPVSITGVEVVS